MSPATATDTALVIVLNGASMVPAFKSFPVGDTNLAREEDVGGGVVLVPVPDTTTVLVVAPPPVWVMVPL